MCESEGRPRRPESPVRLCRPYEAAEHASCIVKILQVYRCMTLPLGTWTVLLHALPAVHRHHTIGQDTCCGRVTPSLFRGS